MNDKDKQEIAAIFEDILANHAPVCPHGLDHETAETLKSLAESLREGKKTIRQTLWGAVGMVILGGIILALKHLFQK